MTASFLSDIAGDPEAFIGGTVLGIIYVVVRESQTVRPASSKWPSVEEGRARWQQVDECKTSLAASRARLQELARKAATEERSRNEAE